MVVDLSMSPLGILLMTGLLMVFILIAKYLFIDPIDNAVANRNKGIEESQSSLYALNKELHTLKHQFEENSKASVQDVNDIFETQRVDALKKSSEIVEDARNALREKSATLQKDLEANKVALREELKPHVDQISDQIIKKVLG